MREDAWADAIASDAIATPLAACWLQVGAISNLLQCMQTALFRAQFSCLSVCHAYMSAEYSGDHIHVVCILLCCCSRRRIAGLHSLSIIDVDANVERKGFMLWMGLPYKLLGGLYRLPSHWIGMHNW